MLNEENKEVYLKNVLSLAFVGDAVFTFKVRVALIEKFKEKPNGLNKRANEIVCARNQAVIMQNIKQILNEEELSIVMRARNSHLNSKAKNSTLAEYSLATQFEALLGYWYLTKNEEKLNEIIEKYVLEKL